jgi:two-component system response regulator (stage 0 sporulation protein A)
MNAEIVELLRRVGVPAHVKGYAYLKDALDICWADKSYLGGITKRLYPAIAKREDATPSRVERAIRRAIEAGFRSDDHSDAYKSLFGYSSLNVGHRQPTNSEFIATLVEQLNIEYGEIVTVNQSGRI